LISDFTEVGKDEASEIYDLAAEFVQILDPTFFATCATEVANEIKPTNLFIR
jgi:hypothetical protein